MAPQPFPLVLTSPGGSDPLSPPCQRQAGMGTAVETSGLVYSSQSCWPRAWTRCLQGAPCCPSPHIVPPCLGMNDGRMGSPIPECVTSSPDGSATAQCEAGARSGAPPSSRTKMRQAQERRVNTTHRLFSSPGELTLSVPCLRNLCLPQGHE